jgi:hypothetical protein
MSEIFDAISTFDQLDDLSDKYLELYGIEPFNVSFWDPSNEFSSKMLPYIHLDYHKNPMNYIFTYQIEEIKKQLLLSFGFDLSIKDGIMTPNGTTSIMLAVHWIKAKGYNHLNVICPSYFSLINNCQKENIRYVNYEMGYKEGQINGLSAKDFENEVFWITNPFYSLGQYLNNNSLST